MVKNSLPKTFGGWSNSMIWVVVGLGGFCLLLILGFGAMVQGLRGSMKPIAQCSLTLQAARNSVVAYAERTGKMPAASTWQEDVQADYGKVRDELLAQLPAQLRDIGVGLVPAGEEWVCHWDKRKSGIFFNEAVAGMALKDVKPDTVLVFERATVGKNQHGPYKDEGAVGAPLVMGETRRWLSLTLSSPKNPFEAGPAPGIRGTR